MNLILSCMLHTARTLLLQSQNIDSAPWRCWKQANNIYAWLDNFTSKEDAFGEWVRLPEVLALYYSSLLGHALCQLGVGRRNSFLWGIGKCRKWVSRRCLHLLLALCRLKGSCWEQCWTCWQCVYKHDQSIIITLNNYSGSSGSDNPIEESVKNETRREWIRLLRCVLTKRIVLSCLQLL